jgi:IS5 family transposase
MLGAPPRIAHRCIGECEVAVDTCAANLYLVRRALEKVDVKALGRCMAHELFRLDNVLL